MKRYLKYIAGATILLALVAALACNGDDGAPATTSGAEPTAAMMSATEPAMTATEPAMTATEPAMMATQSAEATAMPDPTDSVAGNYQGDSRLDAVKARGKSYLRQPQRRSWLRLSGRQRQ